MLKLIRRQVYLPCLFLLIAICPVQARVTHISPHFIFSVFSNPSTNFSPASFFAAKYKEWKLADAGIKEEVFNYAIRGYDYIQQHYSLNKRNIITIVDFSKPSTEERLFTIDLETGEVLYKTLVAHGKNTGQQYASNFSNQASSYESSLGFYITMNTYTGNNGYSLRLKGCEKGFNDKAEERNIVVHGADYVSESFISQNGFLGRSHGCPALPVEESDKIINTIRNGSCLFIYHPNKKYLNPNFAIDKNVPVCLKLADEYAP